MKLITSLEVTIRLAGSRTSLEALDVFEKLLGHFEIAPRTWSATDSGDEPRDGGFVQLRACVTKHASAVDSFGLTENYKVMNTHAYHRDGVWSTTVSAFEADEAWLRTAVGALRDAASSPGLLGAEIARLGQPVFEPHPPIATASYAVLTTDAQAAAAYDDPTVFWSAWDEVETVGAFKLCTRALTALREEYWLGETFETTMDLARAAKPNLTLHTGWYQPTKGNRPWWDYGDVQDEKAGWPLLDLVGYDAKTRTLEYAAKPNHPGHLLLQEIMTLMNQVDGKTADGQPIEVVRAVFLAKAQADAEKRPLLDNGVKVYYLGKAGELIELAS